MKLLVAIVQPDDADGLAQELRHHGHRFTRVASTGGFLETPNVTFVLAIDDGALDAVVDLFRSCCSGREVEVPLVLSERLRDWQERVVNYAGATIMVVDLADLVRV